MEKIEILNLHNIASWIESERLEFKLSTREYKEIVCTVNAFANTAGGVVIVGVNDDGEVVGQDISDATVREISQTILANISERVYPSVRHVNLESRSVLVISVNASPLSPHTSYGRTYKRVGSSNVVVDPSEYNLLLSRKRNGGGADRDFVTNGTLGEISEEKVIKFIEIANNARALNLNIHTPTEEVLESLELMQDGALTKGAYLLFGTNPQKYLPAATLKLAYFADKERTIFLNQKVIGGTLFEQYEQAMIFLESALPAVVKTISGVAPSFEWPIPIDAIRELLLNALIHRDYHVDVETYCSVVKDNKASGTGDNEVGLEIYNPGLLPAPRITPETIYLDHPSVPINRRIARVFFLAGLIEQWGKGASRAWNLCRAHGAPEPVWSSENGTVWVRIFKT